MVEAFKTNEKDFSALLGRLLELKIELVVFRIQDHQLSFVMIQARKHGIRTRVMCSDGGDRVEELMHYPGRRLSAFGEMLLISP